MIRLVSILLLATLCAAQEPAGGMLPYEEPVPYEQPPPVYEDLPPLPPYEGDVPYDKHTSYGHPDECHKV